MLEIGSVEWEDVVPVRKTKARGLLWAILGALIAGLMLPQAATAADRSRSVSGWFGYWHDAAKMIDVAQNSGGVLGEVNIFWWHWAGTQRPICTTASGRCQSDTATPWTNAKFDAARKGLQDQGILVFATHTDLDSSRRRELSDYLAKGSRRQAFAEQLTDWVVRAGVDGIDLDWENFAFNDGSETWNRTRPRLNDMIQRLGASLRAQGKLLSITVPGGYRPFNADGTPNPGGGYNVFDWPTLAANVDRLRLMTYDYSWSRPGPIGPHPWVREVARSAVAQVGAAQKGKIYVGLHQYGKAWYQRDAQDDVVTVGNCPNKWSPNDRDATALTPTRAREVAAAYGAEPRFDATQREYTFDYEKSQAGSYVDSNGNRRNKTCKVRKQVWFGGEGTAASRTEIVQEFGIGGVATWELTSVEGNFFQALAPLANGNPVPQAPPAAEVEKSFTLKAKTNKKRPAAGGKMLMKGKLRPKEEGTTVKRQLKVKGKWRTKEKATTSAKGRVKFRISLPSQPRKYKFRLKSKRTSNHGKLLSPVMRVRSR